MGEVGVLDVEVAVPGEVVVVELSAVVDVGGAGSCCWNKSGTPGEFWSTTVLVVDMLVVDVLLAGVLLVDVLLAGVLLVDVLLLVGLVDVVVDEDGAVVVVDAGPVVVVVVAGATVVVVVPGMDVVVDAGCELVVVLPGFVVVVLTTVVVVDAGAEVVVLPGALVVVLPGAAVVVLLPSTVVVVVDGVTAHVGVTKVFVSRVTAPLAASTRPCTVAAVPTVTDVFARTLPTNSEPVPSVAELPTCQKTLHSWAPLMTLTVLFEAVMSDESVWKMKTELGSPAPSSTNGPDSASAPLFGPAYTPPIRFWLVRSAGVVASIDRPAAST